MCRFAVGLIHKPLITEFKCIFYPGLKFVSLNISPMLMVCIICSLFSEKTSLISLKASVEQTQTQQRPGDVLHHQACVYTPGAVVLYTGAALAVNTLLHWGLDIKLYTHFFMKCK